ncbi:hypothetical protein D3C77_735400 [compost metagenome]
MAEGDPRYHPQDHGAHAAGTEQMAGQRQGNGPTRGLSRQGKQTQGNKQVGKMQRPQQGMGERRQRPPAQLSPQMKECRHYI